MKKLAIALRGNERNSFEDKDLYNYIKELSKSYETDIYIHTWNLSEAASSWRPVSKIRKQISLETVNDYFLGLNVKKIIIDDDENITLHGRTNGRMGRLKELTCSEEVLKLIIGNEIGEWAKNHNLNNLKISSNYNLFVELGCPIIGWKRMWHGIYSVAKEIYNSNARYDAVLNCRLDILKLKKNKNYINNPDCVSINLENTMGIIESFLSKKEIIFIKDKNSICIDNIYVGSTSQIYKLCEKFHYNLDDILEENKICDWEGNQEKLVFLEAQKISKIYHL